MLISFIWDSAELVQLQDPKLWYSIGILYDRYGSTEHAEEAFAGVIKIDPCTYICLLSYCGQAKRNIIDYEKSNEVYFRLGIIYKQQHNYSIALEVSFIKFYPSALMLGV